MCLPAVIPKDLFDLPVSCVVCCWLGLASLSACSCKAQLQDSAALPLCIASKLRQLLSGQLAWLPITCSHSLCHVFTPAVCSIVCLFRRRCCRLQVQETSFLHSSASLQVL